MFPPGQRSVDKATIDAKPKPKCWWVVFPSGAKHGPFDDGYEADAWADRNNNGHGWYVRPEYDRKV